MVNGSHYQRTLEAWLKVMDSKKHAVLHLFSDKNSPQAALKWFVCVFYFEHDCIGNVLTSVKSWVAYIKIYKFLCTT